MKPIYKIAINAINENRSKINDGDESVSKLYTLFRVQQGDNIKPEYTQEWFKRLMLDRLQTMENYYRKGHSDRFYWIDSFCLHSALYVHGGLKPINGDKPDPLSVVIIFSIHS